MAVNGPDDLLKLCIQEVTLARQRIEGALPPYIQVGYTDPPEAYEPTYDEFRKAFVTALFGVTVTHQIINDWNDMPPATLSPGEIRMAFADILKRIKNVCEGLDRGAKYEVTLVRTTAPAS